MSFKQELKGAINSSAQVNRTLLFAFLLALAYVLLTVLGTDHQDLFLPEQTIELPVLGFEINLKGFLIATPFIVLIYHYFVLFSLYNHSKKIGKYMDLLPTEEDAEPDEIHKINFTDTLFPFFQNYHKFYELLVQKKFVEEGEESQQNSRLLNGLEQIAIVIFKMISGIFVYLIPAGILILILWKTLAYQDARLTGAQFCFVLFDAILLCYFSLRQDAAKKRKMLEGGSFVKISRSAVRLFKYFIYMALLGTGIWLVTHAHPQAHHLIVEDLNVGLEKHKEVDNYDQKYALSFVQNQIEDRKLNYARMNDVNILGTKFLRCELHNLKVKNACLSFSVFEDSELQDADFRQVQLIGTEFHKSILNRAIFKSAVAYGACFKESEIVGANFIQAQLQGADFDHSLLFGSKFCEAHLEGASFVSAQMDGVNFAGAHLVGANLVAARLRGADLSNADLRYANLKGANLNGANLSFARLEGANLDEAEVKGAIMGNNRISANTGFKLFDPQNAYWESDVIISDSTEIDTAEFLSLIPEKTSYSFGIEGRNPRKAFLSLIESREGKQHLDKVATPQEVEKVAKLRAKLVHTLVVENNLYEEIREKGEINPYFYAIIGMATVNGVGNNSQQPGRFPFELSESVKAEIAKDEELKKFYNKILKKSSLK